jgi:hypothetical protein
VNARKARCQNFASNFIGETSGGRAPVERRCDEQMGGGPPGRTIERRLGKPSRRDAARQPPESQRSIAFNSADSSVIGLVM